jgi:isocitrate/isopropylmalate dehydrogenase
MTYHIICLPGDGIGPEVMAEGVKVLRAVAEVMRLDFKFEEIPCGGQYYLAHGKHRDWPDGSETKCARADMILLGAVGWPNPDGNGPTLMENGHMAGYSAVLGNRTRLDLYANVRPVKLYPGVHHRIHGKPRHVWEPGLVDIVFVRENTEGLYSPTGGILAPGNVAQVGIDTRVITRRGSERVIRRAFEICRRKKRPAPADGKKRVTCIVKDNVLHGCRVFRDIFYDIGREYPEIQKETAIVDAFTQWLVTKPEWYDVCVTTNMFGDIVTDLASVLQGGMGMAAGANIGDEQGMFEPIHGSAPKYTGQDKANPMAMVLAVHEGLLWLAGKKSDPRLEKAAEVIELAVMKILERGQPLTYDLVEDPSKAARCSVVGTALAEEAKRLAAGR